MIWTYTSTELKTTNKKKKNYMRKCYKPYQLFKSFGRMCIIKMDDKSLHRKKFFKFIIWEPFLSNLNAFVGVWALYNLQKRKYFRWKKKFQTRIFLNYLSMHFNKCTSFFIPLAIPHSLCPIQTRYLITQSRWMTM